MDGAFHLNTDDLIATALDRLDKAVKDTLYEDLRGFDDVNRALDLVCQLHPRGEKLAWEWREVLQFTSARLRSDELARIASLLRVGVGVRARSWSAGL